MTVDRFFDLLAEELKENPQFKAYYKFLDDPKRFEFRKAYFTQRLSYIEKQIQDKETRIWDCGCGYGTTCLFLAMNGFKSYGSTLEFYYKEIPQRLEFWKQYGDTSLFSFGYENMFDSHPPANSQDIIIIQDTLHHLEPLQDAIAIFHHVLDKNGKLILVEENGNNVIQNLKLYLRRGNKRIIEIYDDKLDKKILLGNENIRSLKTWTEELYKGKFKIPEESVQYIRFYFPGAYKRGTENIIYKEQQLWKKNKFLRENFFFGLNFVAEKI